MKPVELIVANSLHDAAETIERFPFVKPNVEPSEVAEAIARKLLCEISHGGATRDVLAALAAAGAPGTLDEIAQRFAAVRDSRKAASQSSASPAASANDATEGQSS